MNVSGSAAHGPTTATRRRSGRKGSADPASRSTIERSASSRASARLAGASRSTSAAPATEPSGVQPSSSSPSSTFCVRIRRAARSTSSSGTRPASSVNPMESGSSTSMPAASACAPASAASARHAVRGREERHRPVVGHHRAGEPPHVAQHGGEQPAVDGRGHAVDVGVGVHHRTRPRERDGRLERREDHVHQLAAAHRDRPVVAGRAGSGVAGEVLQGGDHPGALQAAHVGAARDGDEVGVFAHGLLDPAPPVVAHDVDDRRQTLLHPDRGHVAADRGGHAFDEVGVEGGAPGDGRGVDGGAVGGEPREALLVDDRRDTEARAVDHRALLAHQLGRALRGRERAAAVDAGEVAEPVAARLGERRGRARGEHVLHRRDVLVARLGGHRVAHPAAAELGRLLLQRHRRQQELDALSDRTRLVPPRFHELPPKLFGTNVLGELLSNRDEQAMP